MAGGDGRAAVIALCSCAGSCRASRLHTLGKPKRCDPDPPPPISRLFLHYLQLFLKPPQPLGTGTMQNLHQRFSRLCGMKTFSWNENFYLFGMNEKLFCETLARARAHALTPALAPVLALALLVCTCPCRCTCPYTCPCAGRVRHNMTGAHMHMIQACPARLGQPSKFSAAIRCRSKKRAASARLCPKGTSRNFKHHLK